MIFIKYITGGEIKLVHHQPFSLKYGLGKTREELELEGVFVDAIPEPQIVEGKQSIMIYSEELNSIYYEYIDVPPTEKDLQKQEMDKLREDLENGIVELTMLIAMGGM